MREREKPVMSQGIHLQNEWNPNMCLSPPNKISFPCSLTDSALKKKTFMLSQPVLCDNLEGCDTEGSGRGFQRERIHVYLWPTHVDIWQKPSQH